MRSKSKIRQPPVNNYPEQNHGRIFCQITFRRSAGFQRVGASEAAQKDANSTNYFHLGPGRQDRWTSRALEYYPVILVLVKLSKIISSLTGAARFHENRSGTAHAFAIAVFLFSIRSKRGFTCVSSFYPRITPSISVPSSSCLSRACCVPLTPLWFAAGVVIPRRVFEHPTRRRRLVY